MTEEVLLKDFNFPFPESFQLPLPGGPYPTFVMWGKFVGSLKWCHLHVPKEGDSGSKNPYPIVDGSVASDAPQEFRNLRRVDAVWDI